MTTAKSSAPPPAALDVAGLSKRFGRTEAVSDVDFTVEAGSLTVLLGPAGAGKTTTLRLIAGLERPDAGRVLLHGRDLGDAQPKDRDVAMIFDNLALYPNKTGFENIANPLRVRGAPSAEVEASVNEVAAKLRIAHVLGRPPKTMSGGERQRVALGRALVRKPGLFLLDEPLSSLDAMLRIELRAELKRLQREQGHSFLLATPDFTEALAVADTVVMLREGRVVQVSDPQALYDSPADREVARFVGAPEINILPGRRAEGSRASIKVAGGTVDVPPHLRDALARAGQEVDVGLRPEHFDVVEPNGSTLNASLVDVEPLGRMSALTLRNAEAEVRVLAETGQARELRLGEPIGLSVLADHLLLFDRQTGRRV